MLVIAGVRGTLTDIKKMTASEGENITLWNQLQNDSHTVLSDDSVTLLVFDTGSVIHKKDNILVDIKRGWVIMLDLKTNDSKVYELRINDSKGQMTKHHIELNVTERVPHISDPERPSARSAEPRSYVATCISVGLLTVIALVLAALFEK